jgi:hypothetical protein
VKGIIRNDDTESQQNKKCSFILFNFNNLLFGYIHGLLYTESGTKSSYGNTSTRRKVAKAIDNLG